VGIDTSFDFPVVRSQAHMSAPRPNSIILYSVPPKPRDSADLVDRPDRGARAARLQRALAYFSVALIALSIVAIIIIMIVGGAGVKKPVAEMAVVYLFPGIALPLGALGIIALFVIGFVDRRRLNGRQAK
jgi:magnesium-transporting ATPase (P-type)